MNANYSTTDFSISESREITISQKSISNLKI